MWIQHSHIFVFVLHFTHETAHFDLGPSAYCTASITQRLTDSMFDNNIILYSAKRFIEWKRLSIVQATCTPWLLFFVFSAASDFTCISSGRQALISYLFNFNSVYFISRMRKRKQFYFPSPSRFTGNSSMLPIRFDSIGIEKNRPEKYHEIPIGLLCVIFWSVADQSVCPLCNPCDLLSNKCHCGRCTIVRCTWHSTYARLPRIWYRR